MAVTRIPKAGDRSAWDTDFSSLHAKDIQDETFIYHKDPNAAPPATALDDLTDVNAPTPGDGQVLTYDTGTNTWIADDVPTGGTHGLDDHTDVNIPSPTDGQVLTYDDGAGEWIASDPTGGVSDAADVTYTPADNSKWDSSADPGNADDAFDQLASRIKTLETTPSGWTKVIDESGASFSNFTGGVGTWSSDGTIIKQTLTTGQWEHARFTAQQQISPAFILQADVKVVSAGANSLRLAGLIIGYGFGTTWPGAEVDIRLTSGVRKVHFMNFSSTDYLDINTSWNDDTWYTLRMICSGVLVTAYLDGTLIGTSGKTMVNSGDARYVGFSCWGCEAHFKNIKGWAMVLP